MLQERVEGKWLAAFRRVFALNGIGKGTAVALISETQSRPVLVHLAELALYDLGADFCMPGIHCSAFRSPRISSSFARCCCSAPLPGMRQSGM